MHARTHAVTHTRAHTHTHTSNSLEYSIASGMWLYATNKQQYEEVYPGKT